MIQPNTVPVIYKHIFNREKIARIRTENDPNAKWFGIFKCHPMMCTDLGFGARIAKRNQQNAPSHDSFLFFFLCTIHDSCYSPYYPPLFLSNPDHAQTTNSLHSSLFPRYSSPALHVYLCLDL
eukprot:169842_1